MAKELLELSAYSEGHRDAKDISSVDIQALYRERTGLEFLRITTLKILQNIEKR